MAPKPITAPQQVARQDGLRGALGYGVVLPEQAQNAPTPAPEATEIGGVPTPGGFPGGAPVEPAGSATVGDPMDPQGRWVAGYKLEGEPCGQEPYTWGVELCDPSRDLGPTSDFVAYGPDSRPFGIGAGVTCSTMTPGGLEEWRRRARALLELSRWNQIAREAWSGERAQAMGADNRYFTDGTATVLGAGPVSVVEAIAALEDAWGSTNYGAVQLIHAPRKFSAYADAKGVITTSPGSARLWTANNSLVVADAGYPGTDPDGGDPDEGTFWLYSTGVMAARLGAVRDIERDEGDAVLFETNDRIVRAEQPAAISWLCDTFAIQVTYCDGCC